MLNQTLRHGVPASLVFLAATFCSGETPKTVITLEPQSAREVSALAQVKEEAAFADAPGNFHVFRSAKVGEAVDIERLTPYSNGSDEADQD